MSSGGSVAATERLCSGFRQTKGENEYTFNWPDTEGSEEIPLTGFDSDIWLGEFAELDGPLELVPEDSEVPP